MSDHTGTAAHWAVESLGLDKRGIYYACPSAPECMSIRVYGEVPEDVAREANLIEARSDLAEVAQAVLRWDDDKPMSYVAFDLLRDKAHVALEKAGLR